LGDFVIKIRANIVVAAAAMAMSCWLAIGSVEANEFFAKQTGKSCADCHMPGQEMRGVQGLNATGHAFKDCGYKFGCAPQAQQNTTENHQGIATFHNTECPGGARAVTIRAGGNTQDRSILLFIEPGQLIKAGVSRGSTFAAHCGTQADREFHWIKLDMVID
jgi:hypothetical protein